MRFIVLFLSAFLLAQLGWGQSTVEINLVDSRPIWTLILYTEIDIYRNGVFLESIKRDRFDDDKSIKGLLPGSYDFNYTTLFDTKETVALEIEEGEDYELVLDLRKLDYSSIKEIPFVDQLETGDSLFINFNSGGCFHFDEFIYIILKENEGYFISNGKENVQMTEDQLIGIRNMEVELSYLVPGNCTTHESYHLRFKNEERAYKDNSCNWRGSQYLELIFNKEKKKKY